MDEVQDLSLCKEKEYISYATIPGITLKGLQY